MTAATPSTITTSRPKSAATSCAVAHRVSHAVAAETVADYIEW